MPASPKVSAGLATYLGILLTLLAAGGATVAAIQANDTATITAGIGSILAGLATVGGRMVQAVALIRKFAPIVQAITAGFSTSGSVGSFTVAGSSGTSITSPASDEPGDPLDGLPDIATHPPDALGDHQGDPMTRGEVQP